MKITKDISIADFNAWSGAKYTVEQIINEDKTQNFDSMIEDLYPDGLTETDLNDILWHDSEWVLESLEITE